MKRLLILSLALNLAGLCGLAWKSGVWRPSGRSPAAAVMQEMTNRPLRIAAGEPGARTNVFEVQEPFTWAQLESSDYREYVAGLRAIGCPETTVRDIIVADVRDLYLGKARECVAAEAALFWELLGNTETFEKRVEEKYKELTAMEKESEALLDALFGGGGWKQGNEEEEKTRLAAENAARLDFLDPTTARQVLGVEQRYRELRGQIAALPDARERLVRLNELPAREQAEIAALLSVAELREYRLRTSPAAKQVLGLPAFESNEQELRGLVEAIDRQMTRQQEIAAERNVDLRAAQTAAAQAQLQADLKALVGDARYEEYQRANDYRFRQIYEFARRQGLPAETAEQWYQMEREMGRQAAALRGDKTLTADARAQALDQLRDQLRASASPYLGTNTGTFFERNGMRF